MTGAGPAQAPARLAQLITGSWVSAVVAAMAELGVADVLAAGPRPVAEIARAVDADPPSLRRLLGACADQGLLQESAAGVFGLTAVGRYLRDDVPHSMRGFARWVGSPGDRYPWARLVDSVRTGQSTFADVHGRELWDYLRERPEEAEVFDRAMTETSARLAPAVVAAYDFSRFRVVVDVAGGRGALLTAVLAAVPQAHGVLYDRPQVVAEATPGDRYEVTGGDFFDSVPAGGDLYLLSNVLHDWDDAAAERILHNCRDAMSGDRRLILVEAVMPDGKPDPTVKLMDLNMLVLFDGKQRSRADFTALLQRVGLTLCRIVPMPGTHSVIEVAHA